MEILFADSIDRSYTDLLESEGHRVRVEASLTADSLPGAIGDADVLVVRSTKVAREVFEAATQLALVVRAGAGTDNIDKETASARGVYVCNVPGKNATAVAELTMGLLLSVDRRIADNVADLRIGKWRKAEYSKADGLEGKTMAILGLGDIGLAVAERAKAFGITVVALRKPNRSAAVLGRIRAAGIKLVDDEDALLSDADIVSIHVPKAASTTGLVDAAFLAKLKPNSILLNTSRGDVIEPDALLDALDNGLRAGLDVYNAEPSGGEAEWESRLGSHPNVVGTHHIGASTSQAQHAVAEGVYETIVAYSQGHLISCVNMETTPTGPLSLTIRHRDKVGVLANILQALRSQGINVQQMTNQVFSGGEAAVATITVSTEVSETLLDELRNIEHIIAVSSAQTGSSHS